VKCISLWQPWAMLWLLSDPDEKVFETRGWYTSYRGPLLVHAAKKKDGEILDFLGSSGFRRVLESRGMSRADIAFGAIIDLHAIHGGGRSRGYAVFSSSATDSWLARAL